MNGGGFGASVVEAQDLSADFGFEFSGGFEVVGVWEEGVGDFVVLRVESSLKR